jgi:arabinogalactan oligomer/maltooligosaccharide transport system permease protein
VPFCIWQLKGYYDTIPLALEESAGIDGCTRWQSFYLVVLPLAAPALVITALFSFMTAWNEYVVAALMLQDVEKFTLPLGLRMFQANMSTQWDSTLPARSSFRRYLVSGLSAGAVEG